MSRSFWGYLGRFTLLHLLTYVLCDLIFMQVTNYADAFRSPELAGYMRPLDDPVVAFGIPLQVPRGLLLALAVWAFRPVWVAGCWGWLSLFACMWILMGIGAVVAAPGTLEGLVYTRFGLGNPLVGMPEVTLQLLAFCPLIALWERRAATWRAAHSKPKGTPAAPIHGLPA